MDESIYYPLGFAYYRDEPVSSIFIKNNHTEPILVYDETGRLLFVIPENTYRHCHLPKRTQILAIHFLEEFHRSVHVIEDMIYIVP